MRTTTGSTPSSPTRTATRIGALGAAAALSLVLAACGGEDVGSMDHSSMASEASSGPATSAAGAAVDGEHDEQDVTFAQMMLVHHQGAVQMADMATTQASSAEVKDLAAAIKVAQEPEIEQMTSWLDTWGEPTEADSSMDGMDHSSMPGMMSEEQMAQLQDASGADFDRMFLQMMIEHHQGAVTMAQTEQQQGQNTDAVELADSIVMTQSAEIDQMTQMLTAMG